MQVGIDLGGTKIEAAVLDDRGAFRFRERYPTPQGDYPGTLENIRALIKRAESELGESCTRVGIGHPGSTNPVDGRIRNANSTCLNGQPLVQDLVRRLGCPVRSSNDANCMLVSEITDGPVPAIGVAMAGPGPGLGN